MRRLERRVAVALVVSTVASLTLAVVYRAGGQPQAEGALLAVALGGLGVALATWGMHLLPGGHDVQERHPLESEPEARAAAAGWLEEGGEALTRRSLLTRLLAGAVGALGLAALFPIRSLGPDPGRSLHRTAWRPGDRLVTEDGRLVRAGSVQLGGVLTVFPEGHVGRADSQTLLIRAVEHDLVTRPGREGWAPEGHVAYSKVCTHAGCPVGLYEATEQRLLCPCHQSIFDVLDGARPTFGPATRSLPQLPLEIDGEGFLRAQRDYTEPIGPGFWDRP